MYAFYKKHEYLFASLFVLITQLIVLPELNTRYPDTDNYTHARRVLDLIQSGAWAETPYMHTNYPFGEILHFTRITDVFWLFFSLPAFLFFSMKDAVYWGGYIYQTGILVLSAVALIWALKPVADPLLRLIGLCVFFIQPSVTETYILIKPDHHVLTALFAFIMIGGLTNYLKEKNSKYLRIAGISAGLCLWSSIEGILISYALLAGLSLLFLFNKESIKTCAVYYFYYFISSFAFLLINPPYEGFFFPDNGRLSLLLVTVIGFTAAAMLLLHLMEERNLLKTFWRKSMGILFSAALFIGLLFLLFPPNVVFQPYFPPAIKEIWSDNVIELQSGLKTTVLFFLSAWPSVFSLLIGIIIFKFCSPLQRSFLILTFIPLLFLTGLSFDSVRYARLSSLFTPFPLVLAFSLRLERHSLSDLKKGILIAVLYISAAAYLGINYVSVNRFMSEHHRPLLQTVKPYLPDSEGSILADTFLGPEIVWALDEYVIGSPYHRNVQGISEGIWALYGDDIDFSLSLLKKHRVKAVLIYLKIPSEPDVFFNIQERDAFLLLPNNPNSLYLRLVKEQKIPCGFKAEPNVKPPYLLYAVDFSTCSEKLENSVSKQ